MMPYYYEERDRVVDRLTAALQVTAKYHDVKDMRVCGSFGRDYVRIEFTGGAVVTVDVHNKYSGGLIRAILDAIDQAMEVSPNE